jgi:serine phosphatase RsbU (regulator of sigma subunit)
MLERGFDGRFATAILARLRARETGVEVAIASAGHPAALLARSEGEVREFGDRGTLLGVFEDPVIDEATTTLEPGDALSLYTDGLLEAHAPEDVITADDAIERLQQLQPHGAEDTVATLLGLVDLESDVRDDIAILSVRVRVAGTAVAGAERAAASTRAAR